MFRPDLLVIVKETYAAMFQLTFLSCGYSCCVCSY